jgi:predicted nucleotidyltransferase
MTKGTVDPLSPRVLDGDVIVALVQTIVRQFKPDRIILFGSYAYGMPTEDSDVDLLVVMPHRGPAHRTATRIRLASAATFPMDLLVRSAAEIEKGIGENDWFLIEVLEKGIVLHDRANPSVGAQGRGRLRRRLAPAALAKAEPL